jgi:hypothetical protein
VETTLLNVPKWLFDKRGVNGPALPIPKPHIFASSSYGTIVASSFDPSVDVDGGTTSYTYTALTVPTLTLPWSMWPGFKAFIIANEAAGTNDLRYSLAGPGVVSFIGLAGQSGGNTYRGEIDIQLDGVSLTTDPIVIAPGFSSLGYKIVATPLGTILGAPEPVPLYFKDSLEIYGQVTYRNVSSNNNIIGCIMKASQAL